MAGIGIRYLEFARRLPREGIDAVLVSPALVEETARLGGLGGVEVRHFERGRLAALLGDCDGAVAQGQLANDLVLEMPGLPVAIDLYDPWLIENFAYFETLGLDPYRNDHATWALQMARGDFFLCSSEEQRTFYLGFLAAAGRVNPERIAGDPDLATLIAPVPFGVPDALPPHHPVLPPRAPGERRLLFGGLYDWYDPWTLLDALALLDRSGWTLLLIRNPNPESTPQRLFARVDERFIGPLRLFVPDVASLDVVATAFSVLALVLAFLVAPHRPSLETRLSLRTRFLDALAAGCPVVTSEGGAMSRLLAEHRAGWIAPAGDAPALARALAEALDDPASRQAGARTLLEQFRWDTVLAPLVAFCRDPRLDDTKERFGQRPATNAPADRLAFRLRRRLRWLKEWGWRA